MIKQIGTKIYYCNITGTVLQIIGDMQGYITETTFEQDYEVYDNIKNRDISTIGLLKFEYGVYPKLSENSTSVKVDVNTKELIFSYEPLLEVTQELNNILSLEDRLQNAVIENIITKEQYKLITGIEYMV